MDDSAVLVDMSKPHSSTAANKKQKVYIWDMDETLILLKTLLNGTYAEAFMGLKDVQKGIEIGKTWENHILRLCDDYFFYEQIEDHNKPHIDALSKCDDGQDLSDYNFDRDEFKVPYQEGNERKMVYTEKDIAYRHRIIAQRYKQGLYGIFDKEMIKHWEDLYDLTDKYTDGWFSSALAFLKQCSGAGEGLTACVRSENETASTCTEVSSVNLLVTSGSLIPSLVKCLLFRLDDLITPENVYSSAEVGKLQCFSWIKERYSSPNVQFCVLGDGWEECAAAQAMKWPFVQIDIQPDSSHRFPGLTLATVGHYFSVIYGTPAEKDED